MWQANYVKAELESAHSGLEVKIVGMTTLGDRNKHSPLSKIGGKGVFVKELEVALLENQVDIAVHSMKDVPAELPDGLQITAICEREDPRDAFVSENYNSLDELPDGARI
jgi:hydroxymethylbilane synthase